MGTPGPGASPSPDGQRSGATSERVERLINRDNDAWQNLKEVIEALKPQMGKVRSDPVKKNVDKALSNLIALGRIREAIYEEL